MAGTNGKGSTCAMINQILRRLATGRAFYSPHLESYTERICINGHRFLSRSWLALDRIQPLVDQMLAEGFDHPTEFEVLTAAGFKFFQEQKVDVAVIEAGWAGFWTRRMLSVPWSV